MSNATDELNLVIIFFLYSYAETVVTKKTNTTKKKTNTTKKKTNSTKKKTNAKGMYLNFINFVIDRNGILYSR